MLYGADNHDLFNFYTLYLVENVGKIIISYSIFDDLVYLLFDLFDLKADELVHIFWNVLLLHQSNSNSDATAMPILLRKAPASMVITMGSASVMILYVPSVGDKVNK